MAICTNSLSDYFAIGSFNPCFESNCTVLWRGYVGRWEIVDDRLCLIGLNGTVEGGADKLLESPRVLRRLFTLRRWNHDEQEDHTDDVDAALKILRRGHHTLALK